MAGFITSPSEPTSMSGSRVKCTFFVIFFVSEMCAPLGMGGLGTQPFEVSETFSTPQCFESLFTYGMVLLNGGGVQLESVDFCIDSIEFFIIVLVVGEVSGDSPVIKFVGTFEHNEVLGVRSSKHQAEPLGQWPGWHAVGGAWQCVDGDDVGCVTWAVMS
jgi:hypothetical protein